MHAAVLAVVLFLMPAVQAKKKYYVIDFMGGQSGAGTGIMQPAPAPAGGTGGSTEQAKVDLPPDAPPQEDAKKVDLKKEKPAPPQKPLKQDDKKGAPKAPRDRGMKGGRGESADGKGDVMGSKTAPVGGVGTALEIGGFGPGGGVQAGPRFPYQWYVQTIYKRLWENWDRSDAGNKVCGVAFTIARDGSVKEIKVDESSGDAFFDLTARRAVDNAAPFPPLPAGYEEPTLKVVVQFRLQ